jgi:hypothetical protein
VHQQYLSTFVWGSLPTCDTIRVGNMGSGMGKRFGGG